MPLARVATVPPRVNRRRASALNRITPALATLLLAVALAAVALTDGRRAAADSYSDTTLETFVTTAIEVHRRIEAWRPLIEGEPDEEARRALAEEAEADIARAIEGVSGISGSEYYAILGQAREDEALRGRIERLLAARQQRPRVDGQGTTDP